MSEPVIEVVMGDLFLLATVGEHTPDLHHTRAYGIEINIFPVGSVFGAVIQTLGIGESYFPAAGCGYFIYVEFPIAFAAEHQVPAVGGPAMKVGGSFWRDLF